MNEKIPELFELKGAERTQVVGAFVLMEHNNGINQYFPFLKDYASEETAKFINAASGSDMLNDDQHQKVK